MWTLLNEVQRILIHRHFFTYLGVDHGNASSYKTLTIFLIKRPFFERLTKRLKFERKQKWLNEFKMLMLL